MTGQPGTEVLGVEIDRSVGQAYLAATFVIPEDLSEGSKEPITQATKNVRAKHKDTAPTMVKAQTSKRG